MIVHACNQLDQFSVVPRRGNDVRRLQSSRVANRKNESSMRTYGASDTAVRDALHTAEITQCGATARHGRNGDAMWSMRRRHNGRHAYQALLAGAIRFGHSTSSWATGNILSKVNQLLAFVVTSNDGMISIKGA
ncbi:hypothetical protein J2801_006081 [Paraburkholderia phenoliruptrix]|uniref:hypothetical protein n=1 Tax=Paraburkholderia phenoliruptrix TaxID=252970 RepID=UPI0028609FF9|nr:hypothetical protein [Paraburkholderia phenoliruptrix]MDR6423778.1 hypothetical protein [Paraburkholderia phenoliruptrix]